jgi:hypothetical protein
MSSKAGRFGQDFQLASRGESSSQPTLWKAFKDYRIPALRYYIKLVVASRDDPVARLMNQPPDFFQVHIQKFASELPELPADDAPAITAPAWIKCRAIILRDAGAGQLWKAIALRLLDPGTGPKIPPSSNVWGA